MIVTYPIHTPAMQDAIDQAMRMAKAHGYKSSVLLNIRSVGTGAWEVKLQVLK